MSYYVAFVDDLEMAADESLKREDLDVFGFRITETEGELAACELTVLNPGLMGVLTMTPRIVLSQDDGAGGVNVLFRGTLIAVPTEMTGDFVTLELLGKSSKTERKIENLADGVAGKLEFFDPAFASNEANIDEKMAAIAARIHVDRRTLEAWISDDLARDKHPDAVPGRRGNAEFRIGEDEIFDIQMSIGELPPSKVIMTADVEWEQSGRGTTDIGPWLRSDDIGNWGALETYTPDALMSAIPGLGGEVNSGSGYAIDASIRLEHSWEDTLKIKFYEGDVVEDVVYFRTVRSRYELERYNVAWEYSQPRRERLRIEIDCPVPKLFGDAQRIETFSPMSANDVRQDNVNPPWRPGFAYRSGDRVSMNGSTWRCKSYHRAGDDFYTDAHWEEMEYTDASLKNPGSPTYFETISATGGEISSRYLYTSYPIHMAIAAYKRRLRFVEVSCSIPFTRALELSTASELTIESARLPGGAALGKIVSLEMSDMDGSRNARVTIACSMGVENADAPDVPPSYVDESYVEDGYQEDGGEIVTRSGLRVLIEQGRVSEPVTAGHLKLPQYLVKEASFTGTAEEQRWKLAQAMARYTPELRTESRTEKIYREDGSGDYQLRPIFSINHQEMTNELGGYLSAVANEEGFMPKLTLTLRDLAPSGTLVTDYAARGHLSVTPGIRLS